MAKAFVLCACLAAAAAGAAPPAAGGLSLVQRGAAAVAKPRRSGDVVGEGSRSASPQEGSDRGGLAGQPPAPSQPWVGVLAHRTRVIAVQILDTISVARFTAAPKFSEVVGSNEGGPAPTVTTTDEAAIDCGLGEACLCRGLARFFDGRSWSDIRSLKSSFLCAADAFAGPPAVASATAAASAAGLAAGCQCLPSASSGAASLLGLSTSTADGARLGSRAASRGRRAMMPPVSPVAASALAVTMAYFVASVSLASVRTWNRATLRPPSSTEQILESTVGAVGFAPMLCAVYLAVTKRAETLSGGDPEEYHMPPLLVSGAVVVSAAAFIMHAVFWLYGSLAAARAREAEEQAEAEREAAAAPTEAASPKRLAHSSPGHRASRPAREPRPVPGERRAAGSSTDGAGPSSGSTAAMTSGQAQAAVAAVKERANAERDAARPRYWLSHACVGVMHWSLVIVFIGVTLMSAPEEVRAEKGVQRMSTGTVCTLVLAVPYFATHLVLHATQCTTANWPVGHGEAEKEDVAGCVMVKQTARLAATALALAPMLCVLFLGTQLLQEWAAASDAAQESPRTDGVDVSMYTCTAAALAQLGLSVVGPLAAGVEVRAVPGGDVELVTNNRTVFHLVAFLRFIVMATLYAGVEVVCSSLYNPKDDSVHPLTLLLLPLASLYFLTYAVQWLLISVRDMADIAFQASLRILRGLKDLVALCPMLAVLMIEAWVRARHVGTVQPGEPPSYARSSMATAVLAFLAQLVVMLLSGLFVRGQTISSSGLVASQKRDPLAFLLFAAFHIATLVMCLSIGAVACSLFDINKG